MRERIFLKMVAVTVIASNQLYVAYLLSNLTITHLVKKIIHPYGVSVSLPLSKLC
jgi:hypothetical protein